MSTFQPLTPNWLSDGFAMIVADEPTLPDAYGLTDYPSDQTGEGNWIDMYLTDNSDQFPVGRLWVGTDTENIGLSELPGSNLDHLTRCALELRQLNEANVSVLQAFDYIKGLYYADAWHTGDLNEAMVPVDSNT